MKDHSTIEQTGWRRASDVIGLEVWSGQQCHGQVSGLVFDTVNLLFCVQIQVAGQDACEVVPVRALDWHDQGKLSIRPQTKPQPLAERHIAVRGLPVRVGRQANTAFVYDLCIDPQASRIAAFQLTSLPGVQQIAYTVQVSGEDVERWAGELQISPEVLTKVTTSLHTPIRLT